MSPGELAEKVHGVSAEVAQIVASLSTHRARPDIRATDSVCPPALRRSFGQLACIRLERTERRPAPHAGGEPPGPSEDWL